MKLILLFTVIVFFNINTYSYENIKWKKADLPELPPGSPLRNFFSIDNTVFLDVFFLDSNPDYGWVSGKNSLVLRTTDGGDTWDYSFVNEFARYQVESVFFLNEKVGYASGPCYQNCNNNNAGVFKTLDGGITWYEITPSFRYSNLFGTFENTHLWGLYFVDESTGYVVGGDCNLQFNTTLGDVQQFFYKTTDGGNSWSLKVANRDNSKLSDIIEDENGDVWAISSGILWKFDNSTDNWKIESITGQSDWHEDLSKFNNSFIVPYSRGCSGDNGASGGIRISTNLNNGWIDFNTGHAMYGSLMTDDSTGWGVGYQASVFQTTDGGLNWKNINTCLEGGDFIDDIALDSRGTYWLVGDEIWKSSPAIFDTLIRQELDINICYGEVVKIDLDTTINNIIWNTNSFSSSFNYEALSSRTFSAIYYSESCPDTVYRSIFNVNVLPLPDYELTFSDSDPCEGDSVLVNINSSYSGYSWYKIVDNNQKIELPFTNSSATLTESGTYTVSIIDNFTCQSELSFEINFNLLPDITIDSIGRTNFCLGDSLYFIATHNGVEIEWYEEGDNNPISNQDSLLVLDSGDFYAIVTSASGCTFKSDVFSARSRIDTNSFKLNFEFDGNWFEKDIVEKDEYVCEYIRIRNYRDFDAVINNPIMIGNTEFSIPQYQLPLTIPALSSAELEICFLGIGEGIRLDTILIEDRCSDQYLPLKAIIKDREFEANSKCNLELSLVDVSLKDDYFITFGVAYPNPATNSTKLEYIEFVPFDMNNQIKIELYDMLGNYQADLTPIKIEEEVEKYGSLIKWEINIDTSTLQVGTYIIKILSPEGENAFSFIKI